MLRARANSIEWSKHAIVRTVIRQSAASGFDRDTWIGCSIRRFWREVWLYERKLLRTRICHDEYWVAWRIVVKAPIKWTGKSQWKPFSGIVSQLFKGHGYKRRFIEHEVASHANSEILKCKKETVC